MHNKSYYLFRPKLFKNISNTFFHAECLELELSFFYYFQFDTLADFFTTDDLLFFEAVAFQLVGCSFGGYFALQSDSPLYMEYFLSSMRGKYLQIPHLPLRCLCFLQFPLDYKTLLKFQLHHTL